MTFSVYRSKDDFKFPIHHPRYHPQFPFGVESAGDNVSLMVFSWNCRTY